MGRPILALKFENIKQAEEIRCRIARLQLHLNRKKGDWCGMKLGDHNGCGDYLTHLFRDPVPILTAILVEEVERLKDELRAIGVDV